MTIEEEEKQIKLLFINIQGYPKKNFSHKIPMLHLVLEQDQPHIATFIETGLTTEH